MKLISARLQGVRSILAPLTIELPSTGMLLLRGPSGHGKSSILLGIAHGLGFSPVAATKLRNNAGTPMDVTVEFDFGTGPSFVRRGNRVALTEPALFDGDGGEVSGATAVEKRLADLTRLTPAQLRALTYRAQKKHGGFLSLEDEAKKKFLTSAMPLLEKFETAADDAEERARVLTPKADAAHAYALSCERLLTECVVEDTPLRDLAFYKEDVEKKTLSVASRMETLERCRLDLEDARAKERSAVVPNASTDTDLVAYRLARDVASRLYQTLQATESKRASGFFATRASLQEALSERQVAGARAQAQFQAAKDAAEQLFDKLDADICPTCAQPLHDQAKMDELVVEAKLSFMAKRDAALAAHALVAAAQKELDALGDFVLDPQLAVDAENLAKSEQALAAYELAQAERRRLDQLELVMRTEVAQAAVQSLQEAVDNAQADLAAVQREQASAVRVLDAAIQFNTLTETVRRSQEQEKQRRQTLATTAREAAALTAAELAAEKDFVELVGRQGFLGAIFDDILAEVSGEANNILANIPNTTDVVVTFRSESVTQKGSVRRAIVPVVTKAGAELDRVDGPSGGQESAIELAVDLAVGEVLRRRTGVAPGWLFLDEPFAGMAAIDREAFLEVLRGYAQDRLVLVVDHSVDTNELFDSAIDVEYGDQGTFIRQGA